MEGKWTKAENSGQKVVVKLGPEDVAAKGRSCVLQVSPCIGLGSSIGKLQKRKRLDEGAAKCSCFGNKSILKGYEDFMKSDLPQRVLLLQEDGWTDFPPHMVELIRENFQRKNAAIEVTFDNCHFLLDIMRMVQWDVMTGEEKSIAWIDDEGRCFFPGPYSAPPTCQSHLETSPCLDNNEIKEIKLQLDIRINGETGYDLEECVAESVPRGKRVKMKHNDACDNEHEEAIGHAVYRDYNTGKCQFMEEYTAPHLLSVDAVRDTFLSIMMSVGPTNVLNISHCSDHLRKSRLELFEKQIEITRKCRGNPNIKYAWLASNGDALSKIMMYGPGAGGFKNLSTFGFGVHLTSVNSPHLSARFCDDDENGVRHIVLCRVILGSVEVVDVGSKRFHPSSERFDSGVDNIENPNHYIIWNMNMDSHIFPEYMISFRMQVNAEGNVIGRQARKSTSEATVTQRFFNEEQKNLGKNLVDSFSSVKSPKSPWMPFPLLLDAISTGVSPNDMKAIRANYECFKSKTITRMEFIKRLRMIVGDGLLRSTITSYRASQPPPPGATCDMKVQKLKHHELDERTSIGREHFVFSLHMALQVERLAKPPHGKIMLLDNDDDSARTLSGSLGLLMNLPLDDEASKPQDCHRLCFDVQAGFPW